MSRPRDINAPSPWNMRIWDVENNEWLGQSDPDGATFYGFDIRGGETTVFSNMNWLYNQFAHGRELIWERSTGLTDKHGKEIYEGDIVKKYIAACGEYLMLPVIFSRTAAQFQLGYFQIVPSTLEVVGNCHENPELLSNDPLEK